MSEPNTIEQESEDPGTEEYFSLLTDPENQDLISPQGESYICMETVSLETSADLGALNVQFQKTALVESSEKSEIEDRPVETEIPKPSEKIVDEQLASEANEEMPLQLSSTGPLSLSKYFESPEPQPVQDTVGHNFFDSLSSGLSPMMKSISDITSLDPGIEMAKEADAGSDSTSVRIGGHIPSETVLPEIETSEMVSEKREIITSTAPKPKLSTLFSEDKSGSDVIGKAFFDSLLNQAASDTTPSQVDPVMPLSASSGPRSPDLCFLDPQEKDQFYDAWILTPKARDVLVSMVTSSQGSFFPEKENLTMPGIIITDEMVDPVKLLMTDLNMEGAHERFCLTADHVPQDESGLRQLMQAKCFGAAINLTSRLLSVIGQGPGRVGHLSRHSPYSLQLWYTRLALFIKLRKFQFAEIESEAFGSLDKPDIFYEFYPDVFTGRKGSMAPFSLRLLLSECLQYQGNYSGSLDRLYALLSVVQKILQNLQNSLAEDGGMVELSEHHRKASLKLWKFRECRVLYSILNCMVAQKDFVMAIGIAQLLLEKDPVRAAEIQSALGKVYLQLGDVLSASDCFERVSAIRSQSPPSIKHQIEDLIHKALMCIVKNSYEDAYKHFSEALALEPSNPVLANNMSVCLLYMGRLKEALSLVESTVIQPQNGQINKCLHEGLLFNMCILYELESIHSDRKKQDALKLVAAHVGDSFQTACLKIEAKAPLERK